MGLDINTAGYEFIRNVLALYRTAKYFREKEILSNKMIDHALEAGRLITELSECPENKESSVAKTALEELNKTMFLIKVMHAEGIYPLRRVRPVNMMGEKLKELLELYIEDEPLPVTPAPVPTAAADAVQPLIDKTGQYALPETDKDSDGGFDEIYYGNIY